MIQPIPKVLPFYGSINKAVCVSAAKQIGVENKVQVTKFSLSRIKELM